MAGIESGPVLRRMHRADTVAQSRLTDQSVTLVIKKLAPRSASTRRAMLATARRIRYIGRRLGKTLFYVLVDESNNVRAISSGILGLSCWFVPEITGDDSLGGGAQRAGLESHTRNIVVRIMYIMTNKDLAIVG